MLLGGLLLPQNLGNILNSVIGIASGYITKKVLLGSTHNPIKGSWYNFTICNNQLCK
jgi:hypothetical protein